jgi:hypothetical protein
MRGFDGSKKYDDFDDPDTFEKLLIGCFLTFVFYFLLPSLGSQYK